MQITSQFNQLIQPIMTTEFYDWLERNGYFSCPASTKFHGAEVGGLLKHSVEVATTLSELTEKNSLVWERKISPAVIGLFHDLCKLDHYFQKEDGTFGYNKEQTLIGHGDKSIILLQRYLILTEEEIHCIRWHMGAFDDSKNWDNYCLAIKKYPNVLWTHHADMIVSQIKGH